MRLKVRELRDYLHLHEVPTQMCREKEELVELVLDQHLPSGSSSGSSGSSSGGRGSSTEAGPRRRRHSNGPTPSPEFLLPLVVAAEGPGSPSSDSPGSEHADRPLYEAGEEPAAQHASLNVSEEDEEEGEDEEDDDDDDDEEDEEDDEKSSDGESLLPGRRASLSDLSRVEDIEGLTVRQLKEILAQNFVNFKGCCEKWELMERVTHLYNDQKDLQTQVSTTTPSTEDSATAKRLEDNLCRICMDSPIDCVLLECGHMVTCSRCGKRMNECPICRQYVVRAVHVFRS